MRIYIAHEAYATFQPKADHPLGEAQLSWEDVMCSYSIIERERITREVYATLAQLVEHRFCKPQVVSSNLTSGSGQIQVSL